MQQITEAIIESKNEKLISTFLENGDFELTRGESDLVYKSSCSIPVFDYVIKSGALKSGLWLMKQGVTPTRRQHEDLVGKALEMEEVDALEGFIENTEHDRELVEAYLHKAAELSNVDAVRESFDRLNSAESFQYDADALVEKYPTKCYIDKDGNTALHVAARSESKSGPEVIRLILSKRPNLMELRNNEGRTPLHEAVVGM